MDSGENEPEISTAIALTKHCTAIVKLGGRTRANRLELKFFGDWATEGMGGDRPLSVSL
ncbi:hypothetical protein NG796_23985 [Laspinema sp. A4]|uniref:hypothetical protein n=1 Tax=Laspinema sp. D2d TaxID=2953686 RepID=UPI0021BB20B1|nr:hypothetical protein [Laspinema sp. D2d]MCT7986336.1 hypothetical protein [Laspinema sp. D2d]